MKKNIYLKYGTPKENFALYLGKRSSQSANSFSSRVPFANGGISSSKQQRRYQRFFCINEFPSRCISNGAKRNEIAILSRPYPVGAL